MNVYVAGRWLRRAEAWDVMRSLEARGHRITHDWTVKEDNLGMSDVERSDYYALCAAADVDGVLDADAFVLLHDPGCRGAFVELGIALAHGVKVIVVGGGTCPVTTAPIFYWLPEVQHVGTVDEALDAVDALARRAA